ncbi:hypothetical protein [Pseudomonas sp. DG56-2]|nr:hypothetical protein [Pseudomonas sp. DG56-2]
MFLPISLFSMLSEPQQNAGTAGVENRSRCIHGLGPFQIIQTM